MKFSEFLNEAPKKSKHDDPRITLIEDVIRDVMHSSYLPNGRFNLKPYFITEAVDEVIRMMKKHMKGTDFEGYLNHVEGLDKSMRDVVKGLMPLVSQNNRIREDGHWIGNPIVEATLKEVEASMQKSVEASSFLSNVMQIGGALLWLMGMLETMGAGSTGSKEIDKRDAERTIFVTAMFKKLGIMQ